MSGRAVVVGGGVAGAAMAAFLAREGVSSVVLDKARFPRDKPCGEGVLPHGVKVLEELGVLAALPAGASHPFRGIRYVIGDIAAEADFEVPPGEPRDGLGCRRLVLDAAVLARARREPLVEVREGWRATAVRVGAAGVEVDAVAADGRALRLAGDLVVGADGRGSLVRRAVGLAGPPPKRQRYGIRAHWRLARPAPARPFVEVHVADACEVYTTPVAEREQLVAVLAEKSLIAEARGDLEGLYERAVGSRAGLAPLLSGAERFTEVLATGPLESLPRGCAADRAVLVGDAAGFLDAITGEGVSLALMTARLAAPVVARGLARGDLSAAHLREYERAREAMARDYFRLTRLLLALARWKPLARRAIRTMARHPALFARLLAINGGYLRFRDLSLADWRRLALGF